MWTFLQNWMSSLMTYSWQTLNLFIERSMDTSAPWGDLSFDTLLLDRHHLKILEQALEQIRHNPGISMHITCVLWNDFEALFNELVHLLEALDLTFLLDLVNLLEVCQRAQQIYRNICIYIRLIKYRYILQGVTSSIYTFWIGVFVQWWLLYKSTTLLIDNHSMTLLIDN